MQRFIMVFLLIALAACQTAPAAAPNSRTGDEAALRQLLRDESDAVVRQDIERLAGLWAEDGFVVDARHTSDNEADDAVWRGIDAILDRYMVVVFPGNPQFAEPADIGIEIAGDTASASSTTRIGDEISPAGDRWEFRYAGGRWWIVSLKYNLEP